MSGPLENINSVLILAATVAVLGAILGFFILMLQRLRHRGLLEKGLIHVVFLPERRRNFLYLISSLAFFFLMSGINEALLSIGLIDPTSFGVLDAIAYVGGATCLFLLVWVGLRPAAITEARRAELERTSHDMVMLAFAPAEGRESGRPRD
jgi:hypothetical protein